MNKTYLVFLNELKTTVLRKSYLIVLFLIPLIGFAIMFVADILQQNESGFSVEELFMPPPAPEYVGIVDLSELIKTLPEDFDPTYFTFYTTEAEAESAMEIGKIGAYYVVAVDYLESGSVEYVQTEFNPMSSLDEDSIIEDILNFNLLKDQPELYTRLSRPLDLQEERLVETSGPTVGGTELAEEENEFAKYTIPYVTAMIFYIVILSASTLLLNSISAEKQNRVIEILMTSVRPREIMTGKIAALGLAGLMQTVIWVGSGMVLTRLTGRALNVVAMPDIPPSLIVWAVVFFLLGYAVYAGLMAGVGALVPNMRESSQLTTIVIIPMVVPVVLMSAMIEKPNSIMTIALSLFPLTSPTTMMLRIASGVVPLWQPLLAAALLALTAFLVVRAAAGMFRAQNLLSGQPAGFKRYFKALFGKA